MKKITIIGGGTGTFVVLSGLKKDSFLDLGVVVAMTDSGGSTGKLRDQLGVLPPGDLRQCLVALSDAPLLWRKLFLYRFDKGDFQGHNFGNLFLATLEKISSNYDQVINTVSYVLQTKGEVIPVTYQKLHLVAEYENGKKITGEGLIDENVLETSKIKKVYLKPSGLANRKAIKRIINSDYVVIGPGDLYTSIIPVFLVDGIKQAFAKSKAKIIFIMNLMTKAGQTSKYTALDHINDLEKYLGKKIDIVLMNNGLISKRIINIYKKHNEEVVIDDLKDFNYQVIRKDIIDNKPVEKNKVDIVYRSILRHDSNKLAKILKKIFYA
ncbi:MAG: YvcK family protein [Patescibacteria group bacterium]|nr:YvcK family protein [Patescibacteria group bacterium]